MKLKKTFELNIQHNEIHHQIRVDEKGRFCLTDMARYFPRKSLKQWLKNQSTKELLTITEDFLNGVDLPHLKVLSTKKGRHNSGTYAHEIIAMDFAMWLDPRFKLKVILSYTEGKDALKGWNIDRQLSARANKVQCEAIEEVKESPKPYHYSNEAKMINKIVFGYHEKNIRDQATSEQLEEVYKLMNFNACLMKQGLSYQKRKETLNDIVRADSCA
ncbi:hypothetical protein LNTAR_25465 [Lentisphaera araneosa HTCC2155]|uniref:KilA-N domain-containing protein n=1 Tax=Lentisphaera araneosa HTCC2155 TaxID=313628 RepID=A6DSD5_9BACT|nr:KilA-N domain-containing protein [Lentisphaera araneosa]EDM25480.1 hypothetical protein LNTAR_25465 [Lentisphaera araneosa HTCC2155]